MKPVTEKDKPRGMGTASILLAVLNGIVLVGLAAVALVILHRFYVAGESYEARMHLPRAAQYVLRIPWMVWPCVAVVLLALLALKEFVVSKSLSLYLKVAFFALAIGVWIAVFIAIITPLLHTVQRLAE
jgi:hypothetical protein